MDRIIGNLYDNRVYVAGFSLGEPLNPVFRVFGDWAVTDYGIEHLSGTYYVKADRLLENDWLDHIKEKGSPYDWYGFKNALQFAQKIFDENGKLLIKAKGVTLEEYLNGTKPKITLPKVEVKK